MATALKIETTFEVHNCIHCGFTLGLPEDYCNNLRRLKGGFHCPKCGKTQGWYGETDDQKKIKELNQKLANSQNSAKYYQDKASREAAEAAHQAARANGYKGQLALVKKRIANGICPCCNRYFENLHRHIQNKHSDFIEESGLVRAMEAASPEAFDDAVNRAVVGVSSSTDIQYRAVANKIRRLMFPDDSKR